MSLDLNEQLAKKKAEKIVKLTNNILDMLEKEKAPLDDMAQVFHNLNINLIQILFAENNQLKAELEKYGKNT